MFIHLSQISIKLENINSVEVDLLVVDGRKATAISIVGSSVRLLYSDNPKYEEDKLKLLKAIGRE